MTADRLVIFDVDGTLVDSQAHILAAMAEAFGALSLPVPPRATVLGIVGLSLPVAVGRLAPELAPRDQARIVAAYKEAFTAQRVSSLSPLYPGATNALDALAAMPGVVLGIATGKSRRGLEHLMDAHGWRPRFVTVQVADDHPSKPHPSMLAACCEETGVAPERAVMVGDTEFDMQMARAAGVHALGVTWGYHPPERLGQVQLIHRFERLPAVLVRHWEGPRE